MEITFLRITKDRLAELTSLSSLFVAELSRKPLDCKRIGLTKSGEGNFVIYRSVDLHSDRLQSGALG